MSCSVDVKLSLKILNLNGVIKFFLFGSMRILLGFKYMLLLCFIFYFFVELVM